MSDKTTYLIRSRTKEEIKTLKDFKINTGEKSMKSVLFDFMSKFNKKHKP